MSSAAEDELTAIFIVGKQYIPLRQALIELDHPQPPTPLITDNETVVNISNDNLKQKHSKSMDMHFYWIKDRVKQQQCAVSWKSDKDNLADYHTKIHLEDHTLKMRSTCTHSHASVP